MDDAPLSTGAPAAVGAAGQHARHVERRVALRPPPARRACRDAGGGAGARGHARRRAIPSVDDDGIATRTLLTALDETWERGWQPADVVHVARREATAGSVPLAVALIGEHARRTDAGVAGAGRLGRPAARARRARRRAIRPWCAAWHRAERRSPAEAWRIVLQLAGVLRTAARIELLRAAAVAVGSAPLAAGRGARPPATTACCAGSAGCWPRPSRPSSPRRPRR